MRKLPILCLVALVVLAITSTGANGITVASHVETVVITTTQIGTYTYDYKVWNDSNGPQYERDMPIWPLIIDFEVPLNSPGDVSNIQSPEYWQHEFINNAGYQDRWGMDIPFGAPWVLHWFTEPPWIEPDDPGDDPGGDPGDEPDDPDDPGDDPDGELESLAGGTFGKPIAPDGYSAWLDTQPEGWWMEFGWPIEVYEPWANGFIFTSTYAPVDGPYLTSWMIDPINIGDPPLPGGSPLGGPPFTPIPEPLTMLAVFGAVACLGGYVRRRRAA